MTRIWDKSYDPGVRWDAPLPAHPVSYFLDQAAAARPNAVALDFFGRELGYRELSDLVGRAAKGLQALGVGPGVHVGLYLPNSPLYVIGFFAILKAGGTVVNYSPLDAARELLQKIEDSKTDVMITVDLASFYPRMREMLVETRLRRLVVGGFLDMLPEEARAGVAEAMANELAEVEWGEWHTSFSDLVNNDGNYTVHPFGAPADEIAVLQYTGGTTGIPKGAMLSHANLCAATAQLIEWGGTGENAFRYGEDRILCVLPLFHVYALVVVMLLGVASAATLVIHPRFEIDQVLRDLVEKRITVFPGVPAMYAGIVAHPEVGKYDLSSVRLCFSGGAPLPREIQERFEGLSGASLGEGWGMTETAATGSSNPINGLRKSGSCGVPLPGVEIRIAGAENAALEMPLGEAGEIAVRGPQVMKGYWNQPGATDEAFADGWLLTGDIGYMDEDGFVFIVDRKKDMILSGGFNVFPRVIEEAIYQHPAVEEVSVVGVPDAYRGESAKAFIKLKDGAEPFDYDELRAFLRDKLGRHEMPAAIEIRDELPKTAVGKLSKKELREEA